jgi:GNAT superfamily N-acetyltransferase
MPETPTPLPFDPVRLARLECRRQAVGVGEIADVAEPILGGLMCYTAPGSWTNQAMGIGLDGPADGDQVDRLIDFYVSRGQEPRVEVCPYADESLTALLLDRGFGIAEFEHVMVRRSDAGLGGLEKTPAGIRVRRVDASDDTDVETWVRVSSSGFLEPGSDREPVFLESSRRVARHPRTAAFIAEVDDRPVGAGAMEIADPFGDGRLACLFAASVLPEYRGRGVQQTLMAARVRHARSEDAPFTFIHCRPGIPTERNARRLGFETLYTAAVMVMRRAGLALSV